MKWWEKHTAELPVMWKLDTFKDQSIYRTGGEVNCTEHDRLQAITSFGSTGRESQTAKRMGWNGMEQLLIVADGLRWRSKGQTRAWLPWRHHSQAGESNHLVISILKRKDRLKNVEHIEHPAVCNFWKIALWQLCLEGRDCVLHSAAVIGVSVIEKSSQGPNVE